MGYFQALCLAKFYVQLIAGDIFESKNSIDTRSFQGLSL